MQNRLVSGLCLVLGVVALHPASVRSEESAADELKSLRTEVERLKTRDEEIRQLRSEVSKLRQQQDASWLTQRRAEEVKTLIREVLADADTRSSLAEGGLTAGHNGKHFFLAGEDGNFLMEIGGFFQIRYLSNNRDEPAGGEDDHENGFQMRRAKLFFEGHVFDPKLHFKVQLAASRSTGNVVVDDAYLKYEWADGYFLQAGQFKPGFNREEAMSATRQQAVDRTYINNFFRVERTQAVQLAAQYERWNWSVAVHDGREAVNVDFNADSTDIAAAARAELLVAGDWKQFKDFVAWSNAPFGVLLGGGLDYELAESGQSTTLLFEDFWQWTADVSMQLSPVNVFAAVFQRHVNGDGAIGGDSDQWGAMVHAGVFIIPDKLDLFARWEYLDYDGLTEVKSHPSFDDDEITGLIPPGLENEVHILTFGSNYYFRKRDVKLTMDVMWAPDGVRETDTASGLLESSDNSDQVVLRGQVQLLF